MNELQEKERELKNLRDAYDQAKGNIRLRVDIRDQMAVLDARLEALRARERRENEQRL